MVVTIKTAFVQLESRELPLTRAMVNQMEYLGQGKSGMTGMEISVIGSVSLPDGKLYLFQTPRGLQKDSTIPQQLRTSEEPPRIILTK